MKYSLFLGPSFTLQIPTTWAIMASAEIQAIFLSPPLSNGQRVNMTITLQTTDDPLENYVAALQAQQAQAYPHFEVNHQDPFQTDKGANGIRTMLSWQKLAPPESIVQQQAFFSREKMVYILTGSRAAALEMDLAQSVDAAFDEIIQSFDFATPHFED